MWRKCSCPNFSGSTCCHLLRVFEYPKIRWRP
ncbi:MAG: hypothetical protein HOL22_07925 [Euryarchaeota archaeon]|nr:hypothetical protein [Euryarchaeota archaeon]MBT5595046.1 hypothetical protein [Euryarchaeota archaeon]MBT5843522.1 hypothetical protein [Euryarchaeota archaeon]MBT6641450.1 hypothetical protein [Euryarchaeota archaeon]MBT6844898.1 hypothetical protein [Euryarchaeota archaeon]